MITGLKYLLSYNEKLSILKFILRAHSLSNFNARLETKIIYNLILIFSKFIVGIKFCLTNKYKLVC